MKVGNILNFQIILKINEQDAGFEPANPRANVLYQPPFTAAYGRLQGASVNLLPYTSSATPAYNSSLKDIVAIEGPVGRALYLRFINFIIRGRFSPI